MSSKGSSSRDGDLLSKAIAIAAQAHAGQVDKAGAPYILHPLRVMLLLNDYEERVAAVLHDVIEDTDLIPADLLAAGIPAEIVTALDHLTRRRGETYEDFIVRAARNPIARRVKMADLSDNMDLRRLSAPGPADYVRRAKYQRAAALLFDAPETPPPADAAPQARTETGVSQSPGRNPSHQDHNL